MTLREVRAYLAAIMRVESERLRAAAAAVQAGAAAALGSRDAARWIADGGD